MTTRYLVKLANGKTYSNDAEKQRAINICEAYNRNHEDKATIEEIASYTPMEIIERRLSK